MELEVPEPFPEYLYRKAHPEYGVVGEEEDGGSDDVGWEEEDQDWTGHGRVLAVHVPATAVAAARSARGQDRRGEGGGGGGGGGGDGAVLRISLPREEPGNDDDGALDLRMVDMHNGGRGRGENAEGESAEEQEARFLAGLHRPDENMEARPLSFTYVHSTEVDMPFLGVQGERRRRNRDSGRGSKGIGRFVEPVALVVLLISVLIMIDSIFMPKIGGGFGDGVGNPSQHHERDARHHHTPSSDTFQKTFGSLSGDLRQSWSSILYGSGAGGADRTVYDENNHHQPHISSSVDSSPSSTEKTRTQTQTKQKSGQAERELHKIWKSMLTARTRVNLISSSVQDIATNLSHAISSPGALRRLVQSEKQQEQQEQISSGPLSSHALTKIAMGEVPPAPAYQGGFLPHSIHLHRQKACAAVLSTWYEGYPDWSRQLHFLDRRIWRGSWNTRDYFTSDQAYSEHRRQEQGQAEGEADGGQDEAPRVGLPWEPRANLALLQDADSELFGPEFRFHARVHRRCSGMWTFVWGYPGISYGEVVGLGRAPDLVLGSSGGTTTWTGRDRDDDDDIDHEGGGGGTYQLWWSDSVDLWPGRHGVDFINRMGRVMSDLKLFREGASQALGIMATMAGGKGGGEGAQDSVVTTDSNKDTKMMPPSPLLLEGIEIPPTHQEGGSRTTGQGGQSYLYQDLDSRLSRLAISMRLVEAVANMTVRMMSDLAPKGGFARPRGSVLAERLLLHDMVDDAGELVRRAAVESAVDEELMGLIDAWIASANRHSTPYWRPDAGADADAAAAPLVSSTSWRWGDIKDWETFRRMLSVNSTFTRGNFSLLRWLKRDSILGTDNVSPQDKGFKAIVKQNQKQNKRKDQEKKRFETDLDKDKVSAAVQHWRALLPWRDEYAIEWESLHAHLSRALLAAEDARRSAENLSLTARDLADQLTGVLPMLHRQGGVGDGNNDNVVIADDDMNIAHAVLGAGIELLDALKLALREIVSGPCSMTALLKTYSGIARSGRV